jgi:hypothetical protein
VLACRLSIVLLVCLLALGPLPAAGDDCRMELVEGKRVVTLRQSDDLGGSGGSIFHKWDWRRLVFHYNIEYRDGKENNRRAAIVPVIPRGSQKSRLPPTFVTVLQGAKRWRGRVDSDLRVTASARPADSRLVVEIQVSDDQRVPLPRRDASDKEWMRADHLEIWMAEVRDGTRTHTTAQLGVASLADGQLVSRWLYPRDIRAPLPEVSGTAEAVAVVLPIVRSPGAAEYQEWPFTVAYSDADAPRSSRRKLIATSRLIWVGKRGRRARTMNEHSLGWLIALPSDARFPETTENCSEPVPDQIQELLRQLWVGAESAELWGGR